MNAISASCFKYSFQKGVKGNIRVKKPNEMEKLSDMILCFGKDALDMLYFELFHLIFHHVEY